MIFEFSSYRSYLIALLADRVAKNPAYSLRAMARHLGMAPSTLSEIMRGSKNLSESSAHLLVRKLDLSAAESDYFVLLVALAKAKVPEVKETLLKKIRVLNPKRATHDLSVDAFKAIGDWYHLPILEMTDLETFDWSPKNIARRLGITAIEAEAAIERLERLELLERAPGKGYRRVHDAWIARSDHSNGALRIFHRRLLEKAIASLDSQTPKEKLVGSETFAVDPACIEQARELMEEFFTKMVALRNQVGRKSEVYHLGVQFFNLTKGKMS